MKDINDVIIKEEFLIYILFISWYFWNSAKVLVV